MKRFFVCVLLLVNTFISVANREQPYEKVFAQHIDNMQYGYVTYLLSYPRSGSTLTRYILEFLTHRPTMGVRQRPPQFDSPLSISFPELLTDVNLRPIWRIHKSPHIIRPPFYDPEKTQIIFLLRNYKELVFRYERYRKIKIFNKNGSLNEKNLIMAFDHWRNDEASKDLYFASLYFFDQIPDRNKLLVQYEDLVLAPDRAITALGSFFDVSGSIVQEMIDTLDECRQRILSFYNLHQHSWSKGTDVRSYSKNKSYRQCLIIDEWVKNHYPDLWESYLSHYDENNFRTS